MHFKVRIQQLDCRMQALGRRFTNQLGLPPSPFLSTADPLPLASSFQIVDRTTIRVEWNVVQLSQIRTGPDSYVRCHLVRATEAGAYCISSTIQAWRKLDHHAVSLKAAIPFIF
ncbi:hypothetical protein G6F68_018647 [Rhizopus microsporus]|nr:hypothetical protein G6F68_018647 [Rhizopus microsporus]